MAEVTEALHAYKNFADGIELSRAEHAKRLAKIEAQYRGGTAKELVAEAEEEHRAKLDEAAQSASSAVEEAFGRGRNRLGAVVVAAPSEDIMKALTLSEGVPLQASELARLRELCAKNYAATRKLNAVAGLANGEKDPASWYEELCGALDHAERTLLTSLQSIKSRQAIGLSEALLYECRSEELAGLDESLDEFLARFDA